MENPCLGGHLRRSRPPPGAQQRPQTLGACPPGIKPACTRQWPQIPSHCTDQLGQTCQSVPQMPRTGCRTEPDPAPSEPTAPQATRAGARHGRRPQESGRGDQGHRKILLRCRQDLKHEVHWSPAPPSTSVCSRHCAGATVARAPGPTTGAAAPKGEGAARVRPVGGRRQGAAAPGPQGWGSGTAMPLGPTTTGAATPRGRVLPGFALSVASARGQARPALQAARGPANPAGHNGTATELTDPQPHSPPHRREGGPHRAQLLREGVVRLRALPRASPSLCRGRVARNLNW